jgi:tetratricopeptide (TPR) repeat protein
MALGAFDEALAEVALAFQMNPMDNQVKKLEGEILAAHGQGKPAEETGTPSEELDQLLSSAREHQERGEFEKALDDIARAFVLDPLNKELVSLEDEVQQEWFQTQTVDGNEQPAVELETNESSLIVQNIRKLLADNKTEDALVAIALGLLEEPENQELEILKEEIIASQSPDNRPSDQKGEVEAHLSAARSFQNEGDIPNALDEVAKALSLDPLDEEASALDRELHESLKVNSSTIREKR